MRGRNAYWLILTGICVFWGAGLFLNAAQDEVVLKYKLNKGDVLTYRQVFEEQSQVVKDKKETVHLQMEWTVKAAIVAAHDQIYHLAIQTNRQGAEIKNRKAAERVFGKRVVDNLAKALEAAPVVLSFYLVVDVQGKILNNVYFLNELTSPFIMLMARLFQLPGEPVRPGKSYTWQDEYRLKVAFKGEKKLKGQACLWLKANGPGSVVGSLLIDKESRIPLQMAFSGHYSFYHRQSREKLSLQLVKRENLSLSKMAADPQLAQALLRAAVNGENIRIPADTVRGFLQSADETVQKMAAAYCSRRGLQVDFNGEEYLRSGNTVIRFNIAKALFRFQNQAGPMETLAADPNPHLRRRAQNFLTSSSYRVEEEDRKLLEAMQAYIYGDGPAILNADIGRVRDLMKCVKPANDWGGGARRFFAEVEVGEKRIRQPYFVHLPEDYDPLESYPVIIFLGGGGGRGDFTFLSMCRNLRQAGLLDEYILLVPQAQGRWWEREREILFRQVFGQMLRRFSIDTDRVYLSGYSNGGTGTYYYSVHDPQRFPAVFSIMGFPFVKNEPPISQDDMQMLDNLKNTAVFLMHGDQDEEVDVKGDRFASGYLRQKGYTVKYEELRGRGHDIRLSEVGARLDRWFIGHSRVPDPPIVTFRMNNPLYRQSFWLRIDQERRLPAEVSGQIKGNSVHIEASNVQLLTVFLNRHLVDLSQKVTISINGKQVYDEIPQPDVKTLLRTARQNLDPRLSYSVSLPISIQ